MPTVKKIVTARKPGKRVKHLPVPGLYFPGQEIREQKQTDTVRALYSRTGTVVERENIPGLGVVREVEVDERFTPGWDKLPGSEAARARLAERHDDGQRMTPKGPAGLGVKRSS